MSNNFLKDLDLIHGRSIISSDVALVVDSDEIRVVIPEIGSSFPIFSLLWM